jgi:hypothetical protein
MSPSASSPTAALHNVQVPTHGRTCIISRNGSSSHPTVASTAANAPQNGHPGPPSQTQGGAARLPVSLVYKRLIQRFQRPLKVADERAAMLALRPMNHEWGVVDKIESRVKQQMRAVASIESCIAECRRMHKPRMQEGVVVRMVELISVTQCLYAHSELLCWQVLNKHTSRMPCASEWPCCPCS